MSDLSKLDLHQIPNGWNYVELGDLVNQERGITYGVVKPGKDVDDGVPFVRAGDLRDGSIQTNGLKHISPEIASGYERSKLRGGELLLSLVGRVGETAIVPDSLKGANVARAVAVLPIHRDIGADWVQLCLQTEQPQRLIANWCNTTVQHTLNLTDVKRLPIPIPPRPVRHRLTDILGALDDKIELNRQMNQTLEAMAQALYRHWFVDFGPFQDQPFVDSELGPIPEGWKVGRLGDYCTINRETINKDNPPNPIQYIKISGVNRGRVEEVETIPYEDAPSRAKRKVQDGDIVWSKVRPNRASYFLCLEPHDDLVVSTGFATITPDHLPFSFVYAALATDEFVEYLTVRATGAAYPSVRLDAFKDAQFVIPDNKALEHFHKKTEPLYRLQRSNEKESAKLAETRDYLLPKLISGEIEAVEEQVEVAI